MNSYRKKSILKEVYMQKGIPVWGLLLLIVVCSGCQPMDYDADGRSDYAVYDLITGDWFIQSSTNATSALAWDANWGYVNCLPVSGNYGGDDGCDLAVYDENTTTWYIRSLDGSWVTNGPDFGAIGYMPVPGVYTPSGRDDPVLYNRLTGAWLLYTNGVSQTVNWGFSTAIPVVGDYNGDALCDFAVFDRVAGNWYILDNNTNTVLAWGLNWGYAGCVPVPGDYNDDGIDDLAVYDPIHAKWYIRELSGNVILWDADWGFTGGVPVPGDFAGNGSDLTLYDYRSGKWYSRNVEGSVIAWAKEWGYQGAWPVSAGPMTTNHVTGNWNMIAHYPTTNLTAQFSLTQTGSYLSGSMTFEGDTRALTGEMYNNLLRLVLPRGWAMTLVLSGNTCAGYMGPPVAGITVSGTKQ